MGRRKISIEDLQNKEAYKMILEIDHQNMVPFILHEFRNRNLIIHLFVLINLGLLTAGLVFAIEQINQGNIGLMALFLLWILGAIAGSTIVVPIHEGLHGLAYYSLGAKKVTYGGNLKQFYFFAVADRFVLDEKGIWPLALSPFVFISLACILGILYARVPWQCFFWGFLSMHSLNCLGDFGILSFFWSNRGKKIFTYDLVDQGKSFVFRAK